MLEIDDRDIFDVIRSIREVVGFDRCRKCILNSKNKIEPSLKFLFNLICECSLSGNNFHNKQPWVENSCQVCMVGELKKTPVL